MTSPLPVLFGAAFTGGSALCAGLALVQALKLPVTRTEARLIGFLLGSAALSSTVFVLTAMWAAKPFWFAAAGIGAIAACLRTGAWRYGPSASFEPLPRAWRWLLAAAFLVYGTYTFVYALAPELSPDGVSYHLGSVSRYLRQGGFGAVTSNMYMNLPMGLEMVFLFAFAFGRHSAAALVHWQFLILLPLLIVALGKRFGYPKAGAAGALLFFMSPVVLIDGCSAYVDVATAAVAFGVFYLLMLYEGDQTSGLAAAAGILAGFAYACKMTALPATPFVVAWVAWFSWRSRRPAWRRHAALAGALAAVVILPWLVKNAVIVGNPFSPFLNEWFPNPYIRESFELEYRESFRTYFGNIASPLQIPLEVTVRGAILNGLLGPVYLLAPLALFSLFSPLGRRLLLAAAVFAATYPSNIGTRFLLSSLPFVALALAMVVSRWRGMAALLVVFHGITAWPGFLTSYSAPHVWRLLEFPWKAALRIEPEADFLRRRVPDYPLAELVEKHVPPHGRVLSFAGLPESYTSREIVVVYTAGLNKSLGDFLVGGATGEFQGIYRREYSFEPKTAQRVRIAPAAPAQFLWNVTEVWPYFPGGVEVERGDAWKLRSNINIWDIHWAFDACPITRWSSWRPANPGMYVEIDFGRQLVLGGVRVLATPEQQLVPLRIEVESAPGRWSAVPATLAATNLPELPNARRIALDDLKRYGITHMAVNNTDFLADELFSNRLLWGITVVGETRLARLYRLD